MMTIPAPDNTLPQLQHDCNGNCGTPATYVATIHVVDNCTIGDLTPDGGEIRLLCAKCLHATALSLGAYLTLRRSRVPGVIVGCITCQRPIARLHDLLETEAL